MKVWGEAHGRAGVGEDPTSQAWSASGTLSSPRGEYCDSCALRTLRQGKAHWKRGFPWLLLLSTSHSRLSRPCDLGPSFIVYPTESMLAALLARRQKLKRQSFSWWATEGNPVLSASPPPPNARAFSTAASTFLPHMPYPSPEPIASSFWTCEGPKAATFRRKQKNILVLLELTV